MHLQVQVITADSRGRFDEPPDRDTCHRGPEGIGGENRKNRSAVRGRISQSTTRWPIPNTDQPGDGEQWLVEYPRYPFQSRHGAISQTAISVDPHQHRFSPPLPAQLVSLEIASVGDVGWSVFSDALKLLVELETLQLKGFPIPLPSTCSSVISLPKLRELHLSASPACCTQFIQTLDCPGVRQWRLDLFNIVGVGDLFRIVLDNLHQSPKSMVLHREFGSPNGSRDYFPRLPNYMYPGDFQHAIIGFAYDDARNLAHGILLDVAFWWKVPLDDPSLATIFAAVSEVSVIETVQWLSLIDWNCSPQESWRPLLQRLVRMQSLVISRAPASGLFWALVKHLEGSVLDDVALCPDLTEIAVNSTDCSAGGWIARQRHGQCPVNSYVDLDGARFLELLVYYLELRPVKLRTLRFLKCFNYTIAEIKLLRRLVDKLLWDAVGALGTTYGDNGDQFGAMTINHDLLSSRPGYEECNLTEEERWKRRWW
ncbi:hypothetical protein MSAN_01964600 [Mycena sanguinolenta]|uniref:Uncharacterized protein n=1 Tax=Mycena sanguinolenta TaxID=230812 RepID=A0A8H6XNY2_9AGAR|nr:hypothetical protein MSAN_01964600 [Mycena sanguinolenta]